MRVWERHRAAWRRVRILSTRAFPMQVACGAHSPATWPTWSLTILQIIFPTVYYVYVLVIEQSTVYSTLVFKLEPWQLTCNAVVTPFIRSVVESAELYEECELRTQLAVHLCIRLGAGVGHRNMCRRNAFFCVSCVVVPNEHFQAGSESGCQSVQHLIYYMEQYALSYTCILVINFSLNFF